MGIRRDGRERCGNGSWRGSVENLPVRFLVVLVPFMNIYQPISWVIPEVSSHRPVSVWGHLPCSGFVDGKMRM